MNITEPENTQRQTKDPWQWMLLEIPVMAGNRLRQQVSLLSPGTKSFCCPKHSEAQLAFDQLP